jgi:hypothetical protein
MRYVGFVVLVLMLAAISNGQQANPLCSNIEVLGPSGVTTAGETMTFSVTLSSSPADIKYDWKLSRGTIEIGQGTQSIVVRTSRGDEGQNIEATLSIFGLPSGCTNVASEAAPVATSPVCSCTSDEFGKLNPNDFRGRLDYFFTELSNFPDNAGLIIFGFPKSERADSDNSRLKLVASHARFRKFGLDRLTFRFEPGEKVHTMFYRIPPGGEVICENCITILGRHLK